MSLLTEKRSIIHFQTFFLILIGLGVLFIGLPSLYKRITWCDGYALGDWLINYEDGGFKRRGLSGSIFILIHNISKVYIGKIVFIFISILYILFYTMFVYYFRKIKLDFLLILYTFLPTVLLFPINDLYAFGRKEILLFIVFLYFSISYKSRNIYSWKYIFLLSLLLSVTTLFHELAVFYTPYILTIYFIEYRESKLGSLLKIFVIGLSSFLPALVIFLFGAEINEGKSWMIFKNLGISPNIMNGIFSWPKEGFGDGKMNALSFANKNHYYLYTVPYIITLTIFILLITKNCIFKYKLKTILITHVILLLFSLPIFFLTIDWGRWLNIHFMCMLFISSIYYKKINHSLKTSYKEILFHLFTIRNLLKLIILLTLTFFITMKHVDKGFLIGQNNLLQELRDNFWCLRHFIF